MPVDSSGDLRQVSKPRASYITTSGRRSRSVCGRLAAGVAARSARVGARAAVAASALYNLEIDGDRPGASNHSYVVGEVVASGLGDGVELNARFRRQASWQKKTAGAASA